MTTNTQFFLWCLLAPAFFVFVFDYGWRSGADFTLYYEYYLNERPINIGYDYLVQTSNKLINFYLFQVLVLSIATYAFLSLLRREGVPLYAYAITPIYIAIIFGVGHFRSVFPLIAFALSPGLRSAWAVLFHYGYLTNVIIFVLMRRHIALVVLFVVSMPLCIRYGLPLLPSEVAALLQIERFVRVYSGAVEHFEHRNLLVLTNFRLWEAALYIFGAVAFARPEKRIFFSSSFLYMAFSFDAYLAQKSALFLFLFQIAGIHSFNNAKVRFFYYCVFNASVLYTILDRVGL